GRELLYKYEFPGDKIPIIIGSAKLALEGDKSELGEACINRLAEALDSYIPTPKRLIDGPFLMPVEDVFSISGRGTVVTGRVERGVVKVGEELEIVGLKPTLKTVCTGVEMVIPGDNIQMTVTLIAPIAMEDGLRFAIREGGRTVGAGVVAKVIE